MSAMQEVGAMVFAAAAVAALVYVVLRAVTLRFTRQRWAAIIAGLSTSGLGATIASANIGDISTIVPAGTVGAAIICMLIDLLSQPPAAQSARKARRGRRAA